MVKQIFLFHLLFIKYFFRATKPKKWMGVKSLPNEGRSSPMFETLQQFYFGLLFFLLNQKNKLIFLL